MSTIHKIRRWDPKMCSGTKRLSIGLRPSTENHSKQRTIGVNMEKVALESNNSVLCFSCTQQVPV